MDVSVIIVNYNTPELTIACIKSVFNKTKDLLYEIILIDNDSSDNSFELFKTEFDSVNLMSLNKNVGFGRANNKAAEKACGKYLFFLNSDTILLNNSLLMFFKFMEANNLKGNIGALGTILLDNKENPTHSSGTFPVMWQFLERKLKLNKKKVERLSFNKEDNFEVDYITGAALFMSRSVFEVYNGFDSDFFMYYEESELQKRLENDNLLRLVIQGPRIIHLEGMSTVHKTLSNSKVIMKLNGMFLYHKKHNSLLMYLIYRILYFIFRFPIIFRNNSNFTEKKSFFKILLFNPVINK